ncbi:MULTISPECIES: tyrosine-type recombinase/integrase [unclassified Enterococcus]|jgi:integrase/recombinase XerC|uniref:tyrosine-type recombinase/integrase n=1 Tax=unclassified Enterococcus TaxID=2608891 RepID=UPI003D267B61
MDTKTRKQMQEKLKQRMHLLPDIFQRFLEENQEHLSLSSRYEYAKDFVLFTDYLKKHYQKEMINDSLIISLEKQVYLNFLQAVHQHTRTFQTTAAQDTSQVFSNSYYGISRKQYALNHFLRFLHAHGYTKEELSLLGKNVLPETTAPAPRYLSAEYFADMRQWFIPKQGFKNERESSFEQKNRPRNLAILALLFYCGIKVHELVELTYNDLDLKKQQLHLQRKNSRLNQVPIPNEALPYLKEYLADYKGAPSELLFQSSHNQQISPRTIRQILGKIEVYKGLSPELCRKTYRYYVGLYLDNADAVDYLCGNRYLQKHDFHKLSLKMTEFSYTSFD